jgi:hypothetical protein
MGELKAVVIEVNCTVAACTVPENIAKPATVVRASCRSILDLQESVR